MTATQNSEPKTRNTVPALVDRTLSGDRAAASRLMTIVENRRTGYRETMRLLMPHTGRAQILGVTGPPGAGKSTLVSELIRAYREQGKTVGVVAVDPTSAVSGGALLGDRIRMLAYYQDPGVFVRSMASRGQLGGLAAATVDVARVLDAMGRDIVIIETVGVGQDEVSIAGLADTSLLVEVPGMGDDVQAIKAGVMEIADVFVINKADREGADRLANQIKTVMRLLPHPEDAWVPPIVKTVAAEGKGIPELLEAIAKHQGYLAAEGRLEKDRRARLQTEVMERARDLALRRILARVEQSGDLSRVLDDLQARKIDPATAARMLVDE
ncbi:MAG TPA: methylmalonyl Co-A mutase-associated GTPase MeaB [Chloroflexia bacterium]|nr:methylmalonyl Co-A mutase-associated GTPase MeaB [Chloroflexia bacterium]